jgi:virulence-associated protein VapD
LATHPEVSTIGERRKFYNKVIRAEDFQHHKAKHCSCGQLFKDCTYLNEIKEAVLKEIDPSWLKTNATELKIYDNKYLNRIAYEIHLRTIKAGFSPFSKIVKAHQEVNKILVDKILEKDQSSVFLDSSKIINHALYLSQIKEFDFQVVWLVRDPRAQVASAMKHQKWSVELATKYWIKEMVNNERILKTFNIKNTKLSYSKLCANTENEMKRVFDFVGVNPNQFSLKFRNQEHHIMGNYMRLQEDQTIRERTEWQDILTKAEIKTIEKATIDYQEFYA